MHVPLHVHVHVHVHVFVNVRVHVHVHVHVLVPVLVLVLVQVPYSTVPLPYDTVRHCTARRLLASAPRPWSVEPGLLAEDARCSPTSSWWALVTHVTRARLGPVDD